MKKWDISKWQKFRKKKKDTAGEGVGRTNRLETGIDGNDAEIRQEKQMERTAASQR